MCMTMSQNELSIAFDKKRFKRVEPYLKEFKLLGETLQDPNALASMQACLNGIDNYKKGLGLEEDHSADPFTEKQMLTLCKVLCNIGTVSAIKCWLLALLMWHLLGRPDYFIKLQMKDIGLCIDEPGDKGITVSLVSHTELTHLNITTGTPPSNGVCESTRAMGKK